VAISQAVRSELLADGYDPGRIHALPNGVPVPESPWTPAAGTTPGPNAVYVGRLAREKGLDVLLDAWVEVVRARPGARLRLLGEGPVRSSLEQQAARLGIRSSVELTGAVADPISTLRAADLFILPSREEGMSIALLEAMALGIPVLASAIPGNQSLVVDGLHGLLAPPNDAGALTGRILEILGEPAEARRRAGTARRHVIEHYSIAAMARRHLELFEALLS
jgi:glycosyltransferase involved in cell wall biosynthesis